METNKQ